MVKNIKQLGLIAGTGQLPVILAREAAESGAKVISVVFSKDMVSALTPYSETHYMGIGQVGKILNLFKKRGVRDIAFAGKVEKRLLFKNLRFDLRAITLLKNLKNRKDDTLMLAVVDEILKEGMIVVKQKLYLKDLFPLKGLIAGKKLNHKQESDVRFGFKAAKEIAGYDIGQTVVVKNQTVLAVEAIEGTDEAIERGCRLCVKGGVVVKVAKPKQDPRFDLPSVGVSTIKTIAKNKGAVLAIEAGSTLVIEKTKMISEAKKYGISFVAV